MKLDDIFKKDAISVLEAETALTFAAEQIFENLKNFTEKFQNAYSIDLWYPATENTGWTTGFWTGEIWLAYEFYLRTIQGSDADSSIRNRSEQLLAAGNLQIESFYERIVKKIDVDHHDMGFLYSLSCVAGYKLTGNIQAKEAALLAADNLLARFQPKGKFLQAWGSMNDPANYRLIIDCLLNLPLLYWAYDVTGEQKYSDIAQMHIETAVKNVIRDDNSTWHTFYFDAETGEPSHGATCQGYRDGSAWARGQAWGIYGMALAYRYTKEEDYITLFERVTGYFLEHLPEDLVPYWDLEFSDGSAEPRDSSSASIAACGLLEMAMYVDQEKAEEYRSIAKRIMKSLTDSYAVKEKEKSNGLVLHSTYSNKSPFNTCNHYGVDECNLWGDYFYVEALTRLTTEWEMYW